MSELYEELPNNSAPQEDLYEDLPEPSSKMPSPGPQTTLARTIPSNRVSSTLSHPPVIRQRTASLSMESKKPTPLPKKYSDGGGGINMKEIMQQAKKKSGNAFESIKDLEEKRQHSKSDEVTPPPWVEQMLKRRVSSASGEDSRSTTSQEEKSESEKVVPKLTHNDVDSAVEEGGPSDAKTNKQQLEREKERPIPAARKPLPPKELKTSSSITEQQQSEPKQPVVGLPLEDNEPKVIRPKPAPKPKLVPVQKTTADPPAEGAAGHSRPPPKPVGRTALPQVPFIEQNKSTATDHPTEKGSNDNISPPLGPKSSDTPTKEVTPKTEKPHPPLKPKVSVKLNEVIELNSQSSPKLPPKPSVGPNDTEQKALPVVLPSLSDNPSSDKPLPLPPKTLPPLPAKKPIPPPPEPELPAKGNLSWHKKKKNHL